MADDAVWLIWSIEHDAWWKPCERGYTKDRGEAGRYTFAVACSIMEQANRYSGSVPNEAMVKE